MPNIYIISLSPSIDYILKFDDLVKGDTNRPYITDMYPAGKGIHIAMLLNQLTLKNESIVFTGGEFERYFYQNLEEQNLKYKKFNAQGNIRINLKLIDRQQTECSAISPTIDAQELLKFEKYLSTVLQEGDYVIATGSIPQHVDHRIYARINALANKYKAKCVIDAFGAPLNDALQYEPFLIKPNIQELEISSGIKIHNDQDVIAAAKVMLAKGAQNILVSMGEHGAIFVNHDIQIKCPILNWKKQLVNAAGAGDSMLGGFISEYIKHQDVVSALKMGVICGSATAYSDRIANKALISELATSINDFQIIKL